MDGPTSTDDLTMAGYPWILPSLACIKDTSQVQLISDCPGDKVTVVCNFGGDKYSTVPALLTVILPTGTTE